MRAEIAKLRYLPLPRWTAAALAAATLITGLALLIVGPTDPAKYIAVPNTAINTVVSLATLVFGVWLATLEFGSGTLQRTLTAEPDRNRVLAAKLIVTLGAAAVAALAAAGAGGGIGAKDYSYGQLSQDLSNDITGVGETVNGLAVALVGVLAWCAVVLAPGWLRFLRGDLK